MSDDLWSEVGNPQLTKKEALERGAYMQHEGEATFFRLIEIALEGDDKTLVEAVRSKIPDVRLAETNRINAHIAERLVTQRLADLLREFDETFRRIDLQAFNNRPEKNMADAFEFAMNFNVSLADSVFQYRHRRESSSMYDLTDTMREPGFGEMLNEAGRLAPFGFWLSTGAGSARGLEQRLTYAATSLPNESSEIKEGNPPLYEFSYGSQSFSAVAQACLRQRLADANKAARQRLRNIPAAEFNSQHWYQSHLHDYVTSTGCPVAHEHASTGISGIELFVRWHADVLDQLAADNLL